MRQRLASYAHRFITVLALGLIVTAIGVGVAHGAPSAVIQTADNFIQFQTAGQDLGHDINVIDNKGGLRFYGCPSLTVIPDCAAIQFFGNQSSGFPGQLFIDSGADNNAAIRFRTAGTGGTVTEQMRVTSGGNVGIGTTTPTSKLSVTGNADVSGNVGIGTTTLGEKLTVNGSERILGESNPVERGSVTSANLDGAMSVFVSGRYAYVAATASDRLVVVDVSDPANPVEKGSVTSANLDGAWSVFVSGRYAYVLANITSRLVVVDVSNPANPVETGSVFSAFFTSTRGIFVSGRYAYVAGLSNDRLTVVDVSDPANPVVKGSVTSANLDGASSVFVSGRYAYVATANSARLVVVDVSDPANPVETGSVFTINIIGAGSVFVSGRYAYVTGSTNDRLVVVDVSDPANPAIAGSVTSANLDAPNSVFVSGRYAYVTTSNSSRLVVVDVFDPANPVEKGSVTSANLSQPASVFVSGRYAYVAATVSGRLVVLELDHLEVPTIDAGAVQLGSLDVRDHAVFQDGLNVRGGLNVSDTGALINGDLTVGGAFNLDEKLRVLGDVKIGTGTTGCVKDADNTVLTGACVSDARLKRDVSPFNPVLASLAQLQPVHFTWRGDDYPELSLGTARSFGLIADEAERLFPELVSTNERGYKVVRYHLLPLLMLQGLRELKAENDALREEVRTLQVTPTHHTVSAAAVTAASTEGDLRISVLEQQNAVLLQQNSDLNTRLSASEQRNDVLEARLSALEQSSAAPSRMGTLSMSAGWPLLAVIAAVGVAIAVRKRRQTGR